MNFKSCFLPYMDENEVVLRYCNAPAVFVPPPLYPTLPRAFKMLCVSLYVFSRKSVSTPLLYVTSPNWICFLLTTNFFTMSLTKLSMLLKLLRPMLPDSSKTNTMSPWDPHFLSVIPEVEATHIEFKPKRLHSILQKCAFVQHNYKLHFKHSIFNLLFIAFDRNLFCYHNFSNSINLTFCFVYSL